MPRRKQDKPQHWEEEDMKMEQLIVRNSVTTCQSAKGDRQSSEEVSTINSGLDEDIDMAYSDGDKDRKINASNERRGSDVEDVVDNERGAAVINNEEWLDVKATLASLQQQMQILRLQHFQFMQLIASQNQSSTPHSSVNCDLATNDSNQSRVEKSSTPSSEVVESAVKADVETEDVDALHTEDEDDKSDRDLAQQDKASASEQSSPSAGTWPENDDQGEPASFDCTRCSAVLPTPELLKMHMLSHERRELASGTGITSQDKTGDLASRSNISSSLQGGSSFAALPQSYQSIINDLSNDSLEEYMEIQKPENTHLEHLVKNMDGTVTDPNQCLICKRILSCKSALMMHYRTHTGERPFKCKLCSRAFTTKGNLKTHMGVHRAKPPLRLLHSCIVCNKQFTNALVLNQHVKMHTDESSIRKRNFDVQSSITSEECKRQRLSLNSESSYKEEPTDAYRAADMMKRPTVEPDFHQLPSISSAGGFPFDFGGIPSIHDHLRYADALARQWEQFNPYPMFNPMNAMKPALFPASMGLPAPPGLLGLPFPLTSGSVVTSAESTKPSLVTNLRLEEARQPEQQQQMDVDGDDKSSVTSQNEKATLDSSRQSNNSPKSEGSWGSADAADSSGRMRRDPPPGTTCDICLKTFACRSALEIHYRSHTKHRPFKCELCDKAFTTRGNKKQHILTHKTDDMQWNSEEKSLGPQAPSPPTSETAPTSADDIRRSVGRHQCSVCLKHFSSASAVQIHFRTHTGDRPFKCSICGKAFTTKGNLKVHTGTHIWNGSPALGSNNNMSMPYESADIKSEGREEETTPTTSPNRVHPALSNNNIGWNAFSQNPLMKASFLGGSPTAFMANCHGLFIPPATIQPNSEEPNRPWLWQVACHICNKEFQSPVSLVLHLKTHVVNENGSSKPVTAS